MPAKFIPIGEPANDGERQALRHLVEGLPDAFTVYGNPWLVERTGVVYELDAVVVAPHAVFVVEIKSYRGRIEGTDHDWWIPERIRSPLKLNRLTAQVLKGHLRGQGYQAGQVWVEGLIFLSGTEQCGVKGPASQDRLHTRRTILTSLQDLELASRLSQGRAHASAPSSAADAALLHLFTGAKAEGARGGPRPVRRVREYEIVAELDHHDAYTELLGKNALSGVQRVLRVYAAPAFATEPVRERVVERARWEAQVLGRLGRIEGILAADPPFSDEAGVVLPLEHFEGITLTTWVLKYGPDSRGAGGTGGAAHSPADLRTRVDLWLRIAAAIEAAHVQGVVHRLLRADAILVEDRKEPREVRVTGFDLAKQIGGDGTISLPPMAEDRLVTAAPEVVLRFSDASPASDQFSLGALLALLLTGRPLFETTRQLSAAGRLLRRVQDIAPRVPLRLDEAVQRMLALRPIERFGTLAEAMTAVRASRDPDARSLPPPPETAPALDPDDLPAGARVGTDYEILGRLGQGGMAIVYAAKHVISGRTRALKIARSSSAAEDAIRGEYEALVRLDHPNVVRVIDLTKMVEGRTTLVMERVGGETLRQWRARLTAESLRADPSVERRLAEDLLAGLEYLELQGVTHKDLKPDNLLVGDGRLTIIDFSLAKMPEEASYGGTALYRDPASARWTHATDRFAAALCLFELYTGRHAFEGRAPEPGLAPQIADDDLEPSGLAAFFRKALDPAIERRFPSARAMRDALLVALGEDEPAPASRPVFSAIDATTPLRLSGLSQRAVHALERCRVSTVVELLALPAEQVRAIHAIGTKTASEIVALQVELRARGVGEGAPIASRRDPAVVPELASSPEPVQKLPLTAAMRDALACAGFPTVGSVAALSAPQIRGITGIGPRKASKVVEALQDFRDRSPADPSASTMDALWDLASLPLSERERVAIERCVGVTGDPEIQGEVAASLGKTQPAISNELRDGLARIDRAALADAERAVDDLIDSFGGLVRASVVAARLEEAWPAGRVSGLGIVRLLVRLTSRAHLVEVGGSEPLLAQPIFDKETLRAFAAAVLRFAGTWPPVEPEAARRSLAALLPQYHGDPLALGVRLAEDVAIAETGHLFIPPLEPAHSLDFVLRQARDEIRLVELETRVRRIFGDAAPFPVDHEHLLSVLSKLDCQVLGEVVLPGRSGSVVARPPLAADDVPAALQAGVGASRRPEEIVRDMLRDAATSRGFRMLVVPPESIAAIGRSVAAAIGGRFVSFEDAFFGAHAAELTALERAERFTAQRGALTEAAEATLFDLLDEHGKAGNVNVLGDTALFALCDALDLPRRLYDETLSGSRGFWVLVVPGVIHNRQPRFNEDLPMWHLEGATLPLMRELGGEGESTQRRQGAKTQGGEGGWG